VPRRTACLSIRAMEAPDATTTAAPGEVPQAVVGGESNGQPVPMSMVQPAVAGGVPMALGEAMNADEDDDDDDDDDGPSNGPPRKKRGGHGRRKIEIEYIEDKIRRHITFSKRKAGISKKAYELSRLTGAQVRIA
jgi:hypothetical protein